MPASRRLPTVALAVAALAAVAWVLWPSERADQPEPGEPAGLEAATPPPGAAELGEQPASREREEEPTTPGAAHPAPSTGLGLGNLLDLADGVFGQIPRTQSFSGVVEAGGVPVPGAEVLVTTGQRWVNEDQPVEPQQVLICDAAGRFRGEASVDRNLRLALTPRAAGWQPKDRLWISEEAGAQVDGLTLRLFPAVELYGSVTLESGAVVVGAQVTAELGDRWQRNRTGEVKHTTYAALALLPRLTGLDGQFAWEVAEGDYDLHASHEDHGEAGVWRKPATDSPLDLVLQEVVEDPGSRIIGRVRRPDGSPADGAGVKFVTSGPSTEADQNGEFVLDGVKAHWSLPPQLLVWAVGCSPQLIDLGELRPLIGPLQIDLQAGAALAGVVLDGAGEPVPRREVVLLGLHEFADGTSPARNLLNVAGRKDEIRTDAEGRFRFESLPIGAYTVAVGDRFAPLASVVATAGQEDLVLTLGELEAPALTIHGQVVGAHDGAPLANAEVLVNSVRRSGPGGWSASGVRTVRTTEDGRYRAEGLPPGEYYFEARLDGFARGKTAPEVEEVGEKSLDFRLFPERTIRVVVQDADGKPIAGASVEIRDATGTAMMIWSGDGSGRTPGNTDDEGVLLAHRMPGGPAEVVVWRSGKANDKLTRQVDWSGEGPHRVTITLP